MAIIKCDECGEQIIDNRCACGDYLDTDRFVMVNHLSVPIAEADQTTPTRNEDR